MHIPTILALASCLLSGPGLGSTPLRTLADAMSELETTNAVGIRFDFTGIVTHVRISKYNQNLTLRDGETYGSVLGAANLSTAPGDLVHVSGVTRTADYGWKNLYAKTCETVGRVSIQPPRHVSAQNILNGEVNYQIVSVSGYIVDVVADDVDPSCAFIILKTDSGFVRVAHHMQSGKDSPFKDLVDAKIEVTGYCEPASRGARTYFTHYLSISDNLDSVRIVEPPPDSPYDIERIGSRRQIHPSAISKSGKRRADGLVLATWKPASFLLRTDDAQLITVNLRNASALPGVLTRVACIGYPDTDLFYLSFSKSDCKILSSASQLPESAPEHLSLRQFLIDPNGQNRFNVLAHGKLIRLRGIAHGLIPECGYFNLEADSNLISVDASSHPEILKDLTSGCQVEVTGVCLIDAESWHTDLLFPRIRGFRIVPRQPDDIRILAHPPWWTPRRLLYAFASLVGLAIAAIAWGWWLNRLVERRSRELAREQIAHRNAESRREDRTRLAVELHDSLSQNLAAVAFQISSAKGVQSADPSRAMERLGTAEKMLDSCRSELRNCLGDLRSNALEQRNFEQAVRQTVDRVRCDAEVRVSLPIARTRLSDSVAHAIMMILRELVSNAVRHGQARQIDIRGELAGVILSIRVTDDGHGFDTGKRPGIREGHFGVEGIRQRTKRLNGTFALESTPGAGTKATLTIPIGDCAS